MAITEKVAPTHVNEAYARLLEQFKVNPEMREMLRTWVEQLQDLETAAFEVLNGRSIDDAEGEQLDGIGKIVGQPREAGISDAAYRLRLHARILLNKSSGTIPQILEIFSFLIESGQTSELAEYPPASFLLNIGGTPSVSAETAAELNRILQQARPAGVGAGLIYADVPSSDRFRFAPADAEVVDPDHGFGGLSADLSWTSVTPSVDNQWTGIAFSPTLGTGQGRLCAVSTGAGNQVITSDDGGVTWTARSASAARTWQSVCWSPALSLFVAVANDGALLGRVMTSPNGITWTNRTAADGDWSSVAWSPTLARFVAVGLSSGTNYAMTSTNGTTWTVSGVTQVPGYWTHVVSAGALGFVAVSQFDLSAGQVMVASDGLSWAGQTAAGVNTWQRVAYSPSLTMLVSVATDGSAMSSPDGVNWTLRTAAAPNQWWALCWSSTLALFIALSFDGTDRVMTSADGIAWVSSSAAADKQWLDVIEAVEIDTVVAVATDGNPDAVMIADTGVVTSGGKFADVVT